ncbi:MAG: DUF1631 domain-containing protein [Gammaproteobacteria bacterium]|uniref:DUF1631 family protein n=1 Tax=Hydrogenophaga sp. TaxID=1904254 RepID=UPI0025BAD57E|nr:DUF1631 family protein [Hydrogenophaga sp.]MBU4184039.1 DUF1631 domain-containing protein [Gammaproteobacteria bacterium]MBU4282991.1 DUF1631 domain-containing protein [Gammaproteobacteria bacterium]MBU4323237.1 DUF1631 domain-containing protein [Gammaproteobacteria bacterium]MBU4508061.1 DUF1631 domain-containing protein [Gammaproteobacteria bacterium]MCG2655394.1 DUF1631 domain-containing protein [Hydrogenophaga sp.]
MNTQKLIRSGVANDTGKLRPSLQHGLEAALSVSDSMIDEVLAHLSLVTDPGRLTNLPQELAAIDPDQVEQLVLHSDALKATWDRELRRQFFEGGGHENESQLTVRFDDLRQLDDRHIDASIEFAMVEQELSRATAGLLPRLNALMSSLMGWLTVQPDLNPLRPAAYARALRAVLLVHVPDPAQRSALFVPVAGILGESLRQVYRELIQWLHAHGVEPLESPQTLLQDKTPRNAVGRTLLTLGHLRQLLAGDFSSQDAGEGFIHTMPLSMNALEDMDLIEPLIQRLRQRVSAPAAQPPVAELPVVSGHNLGRLLGQEVVRLMLENLTRDERLLPVIRQQIGLLEPALIQLALADPRFFSERQHPARLLLESITQRSLGYLSPNEEGFSDLLRSITAAVRSINRVQASEEVFSRLLKRLRRRWEEDDMRKNQLREEATRALLHAEQRQMLAERLAIDFQHRMQGKEVPEFVQRFLSGPWAQALAESQLVFPAQGDEAAAMDGVADDLIWSAQPALIRRDAERLLKLVPRLLGQLRQGLQRIEYPDERMGQFFDALVALHELAFESPVLPVLTAHATPAPTADSAPADAAESFWMADSEAAEAGFVAGTPQPEEPDAAQPAESGLSTGAWVDLLTQGQWVRAQLTWTSPRGSLFMFISASGLAHSMTRRTLDRLLGTDALRIVSRGGVVEGALDAVAQQALRNARVPDDTA